MVKQDHNDGGGGNPHTLRMETSTGMLLSVRAHSEKAISLTDLLSRIASAVSVCTTSMVRTPTCQGLDVLLLWLVLLLLAAHVQAKPRSPKVQRRNTKRPSLGQLAMACERKE